MRRATPCTARTHCSQLFQSTLSMRRTTDDDPGQRHGYRISIHALHEESDMLRESEAYGPSSFQSTLSMRRATVSHGRIIIMTKFQSTLSMRRATSLFGSIKSTYALFQSTLSMRRATRLVQCRVASEGISIHALHEESDCHVQRRSGNHGISIHALHEESDPRPPAPHPSQEPNFNPRSP